MLQVVQQSATSR